MRITIDKAAILPALDLARRVAERGDGIMSCALLRAEAHLLIVTGSDYGSQVSSDLVPDTGGAPGSACVNADTLFRVVAALPAGATVCLELIGSGVVVSCGRRRSTLPTMPVDEFPLSELDVADEHVADVDAAALLGALTTAIPMSSDDDSRPQICGVSLRVGYGAVVLSATDGKRFAQLTAAAGTQRNEPVDRLLHKPAAAVLSRICAAAPVGDVSVHFGALSASFETAGGVRFVSRSSDAEFPDASGLMPDRGGFVVSTAKLDAALAGAMAIGVEAVELSIELGVLRVRADGFVDDFEVEPDAVMSAVGFNCRLVRDALAACKSDDVEITGRDQFGPYRFDGRDGGVFIVMPFRL